MMMTMMASTLLHLFVLFVPDLCFVLILSVYNNWLAKNKESTSALSVGVAMT